jgi:hypothetical protein
MIIIFICDEASHLFLNLIIQRCAISHRRQLLCWGLLSHPNCYHWLYPLGTVVWVASIALETSARFKGAICTGRGGPSRRWFRIRGGISYRNASCSPVPMDSSRSHVTTDAQSVSQYVKVSSPISDLRPDVTFCPKVVFWKLLSRLCGAPSLMRGRVCSLQCNYSMFWVAQNP